MKLKQKSFILVSTTFVGIFLIAHYYGFFDSDNGKLYSSKALLCQEFALSYLRTMPTTEDNFDGKKWEMAVDVETELYDLCMLDLSVESLVAFEANSLNKYKDLP